MRQRKRKINPTLFLMKNGSLKFKRRVDFPMWHPDHISKVANILREFADRLDAIHGSNSLRGPVVVLHRASQAENHDDRVPCSCCLPLGSCATRMPRSRTREHSIFLRPAVQWRKRNTFSGFGRTPSLFQELNIRGTTFVPVLVCFNRPSPTSWSISLSNLCGDSVPFGYREDADLLHREAHGQARRLQGTARVFRVAHGGIQGDV